jgi:hypothetical protein
VPQRYSDRREALLPLRPASRLTAALQSLLSADRKRASERLFLNGLQRQIFVARVEVNAAVHLIKKSAGLPKFL